MPKGMYWIIAGIVIAIFGVVLYGLSFMMMADSAIDWGTSWGMDSVPSDGWVVAMLISFVLMVLGGILFVIGLIVLVLNA